MSFQDFLTFVVFDSLIRQRISKCPRFNSRLRSWPEMPGCEVFGGCRWAARHFGAGGQGLVPVN